MWKHLRLFCLLQASSSCAERRTAVASYWIRSLLLALPHLTAPTSISPPYNLRHCHRQNDREFTNTLTYHALNDIYDQEVQILVACRCFQILPRSLRPHLVRVIWIFENPTTVIVLGVSRIVCIPEDHNEVVMMSVTNTSITTHNAPYIVQTAAKVVSASRLSVLHSSKSCCMECISFANV